MAAANPTLVRVDDAVLEPWRRFFSGVDVFNVIVHAVLVAATDSPQEFRRRRDSIVEQIFIAPAVVPTMGAAGGEAPGIVAKHVTTENGGNDDVVATGSCKGGPPCGGNEEKKEMAREGLATGSNQHEVHGHSSDNNDAAGACAEMGLDWLHILADEMDEAKLENEEVLRIKAILINHHEQSVDVLFDSLRRLQLMQLTVDTLKSTEIGVTVSALRKHKSHKIRKLVQDIRKAWKVVVNEWIAATKVAMGGDSTKILDKPNTSAAEDEGGLAIPPMDIGALFMSHATAIQHVSEFLDGMDGDDDGILNNHIIRMDKNRGSGSKRTCKGPGPSDTMAGTKQPIIAQGLSETQGSGFRERNPQKRRCGIENDLIHQQQDSEEREGHPLQRDPINKILNVSETTVHKTQVVLPKRQEVAFLATNTKKSQESGRSRTCVFIKFNKPSSTEGEPRSLSKGTPDKPPHEDVKPRHDRGGVTLTGDPPIGAARKPPFGHVIKTGTPVHVQSLEAPKVGLGKRNIHLADMGLERTKRRLREAYEEAENAKRKRTIQVVEPHDIPKPMERRPVMKSRHPIRRTS